MGWNINNLQKAREVIRRKAPYLTMAVYKLRPVEVPGLGTLAVDSSQRLYYDPEAIKTMPLKLIASVVVHEVLHVLDRHAERAQACGVKTPREAGIWNIAADIALYQLMKSGGWDVADHLKPADFDLEKNKTVEHYYRKLLEIDEPPEPPESPCPGEGRSGSCATNLAEPWEKPPESDDATRELQRDLLRRVTAQAMEAHAKCHGRLPAGYGRLVDEILSPPTIPWRRVFAGMVRSGIVVSGKSNYSRQRPSRRQQCTPDVLRPAMIYEVPRVAVVIDTSGSMSEADLSEALSEVAGILRAVVGREGTTVLSCDSAVHTSRSCFRTSQIELTGGGGTDMTPGLEAVARLRPEPSVVVVITDGHVLRWPKQKPTRCPVIILLAGEGHASLKRVPKWARGLKVDRQRKDI